MMVGGFLPWRVLVVGGGYIGREFGQMYGRFGSEVELVEKSPRLIPNEDEDVSAAVKDILEREGIEIRLNAECIHFAKRGEEIIAGVDCSDGAEISGSHLLLAVGRRPNTGDLCLENAGVATAQREYITVDDELRTNVPGIWALGDSNVGGPFQHTSYDDVEMISAN